MKKYALPVLCLCSITMFVYSCSKTSSYSNTDETTGLVNKTRSWSGYSSGYYKGDTLYTGDTTHHEWARSFYHVISDTSFSVQKINGYQISAMGTPWNYLSTDNVNHIVRFDTTLSGSPVSYLDFYSARDSVYLQYHMVGAYNAASGRNYETDIYLHTNP